MEEELLELFRILPEDQKHLFLDYLKQLVPDEAEEQ